MSLPKSPLTQKLARIFLLPAIVVCICSSNCPAYRLVGSEALSDALVAHHYSINATLDAVIVVDPTVPTFEYHTFFAMGHADEPEGEQGKLHFLEHIIAGTGSRPLGELNQLIARNGGRHHAYTARHMTHFSMKFPKDKLELAVEIDRDRFYSTLIDQEIVDHERQAVLTELSGRRSDQRNRFNNRFLRRIYGRATYEAVGTMDLIEEIESADLKRLYDDTFRLQRRLVVLIGDVDKDEVVLKLVAAFPETTGQRETDLPISRFPNPKELGKKYHSKYRNPSVSRFKKAWWISGLDQPDHACFLILASLLTKPLNSLRSSLLDSNVVNTFNIWVSNHKGFGLLNCYAEMPPVTSMRTLEKSIRDELRRIETRGISEIDLAAARNRALRTEYSDFYDRSKVAVRFGEAFAHTNDPLGYPKLIRRLDSVTTGDISRVVNEYLSNQLSIQLSWKLKRQNPLWARTAAIVILALCYGGIVLAAFWVVRKLDMRFSG